MTYVTVDWHFPIGKAAVQYAVRSSNFCDPGLPDDSWPENVRELVQRRRQTKGGARKGRVLYLLEDPGASRELTPVAVMPYHVVSSREIEVWSVACALEVMERERQYGLALLACADGILRKHPSWHGSAKVVWPVAQVAVQSVREKYGFRTAGKKTDGRTILERQTTARTENVRSSRR
jgi:hypothetical protein